jgi:hypothetical protein
MAARPIHPALCAVVNIFFLFLAELVPAFFVVVGERLQLVQ